MDFYRNPAAEETLPMSMINRGQGGMNRTSAPIGPNHNDSGALSKSEVNAQPSQQQMYKGQEITQNMQSAVPGHQSAQIQGLRKMNADESDRADKAQHFLAERTAEMMYANESGAANMQLNAAMKGIDGERIKRNVGIGQAMSMNMSPDLGDIG